MYKRQVFDTSDLDDATSHLGTAFFSGLAFERFEGGLASQTTDTALVAVNDAGAAFVEHAFIESDDDDACGGGLDDQGGEGRGIDRADKDGGRFGVDGLAELSRLFCCLTWGLVDGELVTGLTADEHGEAVALEFLHGDADIGHDAANRIVPFGLARRE